MKRSIDILILSDIHLGTFGCQAKKLLNYLHTIDPKTVILNGDIVDLWLFDENKWPRSHIQILQVFLHYVKQHKPVYYMTGNHDDSFRQAAGLSYSNLHLTDELIIEAGGRKYWVQHGDKFDKSVSGAMRNMAVWGGKTYDRLVKANRDINQWLDLFGMQRVHFSKRLKEGTKKRVRHGHDFIEDALKYSAELGCHGMICGHIHQPEIATKNIDGLDMHYLNSGDWVENCTALEFYNHQWHLYRHPLEDPILLTDFLTDKSLGEDIDVSFTSIKY